MAELYMNHLSVVAGSSCDPNWVVTLGKGQRSWGKNDLFCLFVRIFGCDGRADCQKYDCLPVRQWMSISPGFVPQDMCLSKMLSNFCTLLELSSRVNDHPSGIGNFS